MKILELGKHRRARIWIGELPEATCPSLKTISRAFRADRESWNGLRLAAVEMFVPLGPRSLYGLLGGQMQHGTTGHLSVDVCTTSATERLLGDSLALKGDEVRVGLPAEYVQAVFAGVEIAKKELGALTAGTLSINCAAHGAIGSCEMLYKHLAAVLVKLFNTTSLELSDEDLVKLFPPTFS